MGPRAAIPVYALVYTLVYAGIAFADGAAAQAQAAKVSAVPEVHPGAELSALIPKLANGRPLVLHFCATWCGACAAEFKKLQSTFRGLDARGVSFALVWIDDEKTRAKIPAMTSRYRLSGLPALALDAPEPEPIAKALAEPSWDGALPATFVYGIHQEKLSSFLGVADQGRLNAAIVEALRRAK